MNNEHTLATELQQHFTRTSVGNRTFPEPKKSGRKPLNDDTFMLFGTIPLACSAILGRL